MEKTKPRYEISMTPEQMHYLSLFLRVPPDVVWERNGLKESSFKTSGDFFAWHGLLDISDLIYRLRFGCGKDHFFNNPPTMRFGKYDALLLRDGRIKIGCSIFGEEDIKAAKELLEMEDPTSCLLELINEADDMDEEEFNDEGTYIEDFKKIIAAYDAMWGELENEKK